MTHHRKARPALRRRQRTLKRRAPLSSQPTSFQVESLESRQMMAFTVSPDFSNPTAPILNITVDNGNLEAAQVREAVTLRSNADGSCLRVQNFNTLIGVCVVPPLAKINVTVTGTNPNTPNLGALLDMNPDSVDSGFGPLNRVVEITGGSENDTFIVSPLANSTTTGGGGDDSLTVDFSGVTGTGSATISFDGGAANDAMSILANGNTVYTPDATTNGKGTITSAGRTISFSGLEPVDFDFITPANFDLNLPNAADGVLVTNGTTSIGGDPALVISGTSGGVPFEAAHVRNAATITIDTVTGGSDGTDNVSVSTADNAHLNQNLRIVTGDFSDSAQVISAKFSGNVSIDTGDNAGIDFSLVRNSEIGGNLTFDQGNGLARFTVEGIKLGGSLLAKTTTGRILIDIDNGGAFALSDIDGNVRVETAGADDRFDIDRTTIDGDVTFLAGDGRNVLYFEYDTTIHGRLFMQGGTGVDSLTMDDVTKVDGDVEFQMGAGDNFVLTDEVVKVGGNFTIRSEGGGDFLTLSDASVTGDLDIDTGDGADTVQLESFSVPPGSSIGGNLKVKTGGGPDTISLNPSGGNGVSVTRNLELDLGSVDNPATETDRVTGSGTTSVGGNVGITAAAPLLLNGSGLITGSGNAELSVTAADLALTQDLAISVTGGATLVADDMAITKSVTAGTSVSVNTTTAGRTIDLGTDSVGALGLTDTELDFLAAPALNVGGATSGDIKTSANITRSATTAVGVQTATTATVAAGTTLDTNGGSLTPATSVLVVNGTVQGNVNIPLGSTLQGSGTINGNVAGAGDLAPGNSPGLLTINGNLAPSGTVTFEINAPGVTPGVDHDLIDVNGGTVTLSGPVIFTGTIGFTPGQSIVLIDNDGNDPVVGNFAGLPQGTIVTVGNTYFRIVYNGGDGNDVALQEGGIPSAPITWEAGGTSQVDNVGAAAAASVTTNVGPGMNKVLVVSAAWNDTTDVDLLVTDVSGGVVPAGVTPINLTLDDAQIAQGQLPEEIRRVVYDNTTLTTAIWVIPLDDVTPNVDNIQLDNAYNAMNRIYRVTMTAGTSTDVYLRADVYKNASQVMIPGDKGDAAYSSNPATNVGHATGFDSSLDGAFPAANRLNQVNSNDMLVDIFAGLQLTTVPMSINPDLPGGQVLLNQRNDWGNPPGSGGLNMYDAGTSYEPASVNGLNDNMTWFGQGLVPGDRYLATSHSGIVLAACGLEGSGQCAPTFYDFGDAPNSYGTDIAANGARHAPKGPTLGATRDAEIDGNPSAGATSDDLLPAPDDEDGVTQTAGAGPSGQFSFVTQKMANNSATLALNVQGLAPSQTGYYTIYIDWDKDGLFESGQELYSGSTGANGAVSVNITVPKTADVAAPSGGFFDTYMRVRLHTNPMAIGAILPPTGHADDGEVEDYSVRVYVGAEIHGYKYHDVNGNGTIEAGDSKWTYGAGGPTVGAPFNVQDGVWLNLVNTVTNTPAVDLFGNVIPAVKTNEQGAFWFPNLAPGTYAVQEDLAKTDSNKDGVGDGVGAIFSNPAIAIDQGLRQSGGVKVNLSASQCLEDTKLLNYVTGSIHGFKFEDKNGDGDQDAGEGPLKGILFQLWKFAGSSSKLPISSSTPVTYYNWTYEGYELTDIHGEFWFTNLAPGKYEVMEVQSQVDGADGKTWIQSTPQRKVAPAFQGKDPKDAPTSFLITVTSGQEYVWAPGKMKMVQDFNNNGFQDANEIAYANAEVALKTEVLAGNSGRDLWWGDYKNAIITGFKYEDVDRSGTYDSKIDIPFPGVKMELVGKSNLGADVKLDTLTDAGGNFSFEVPPGSYSVSESTATDTLAPNTVPGKNNPDGIPDNQQDMVLDAFVEAVSVNSADSKALSHKWANYIFGSIHGVKFEDKDADGFWDQDEAPLKDVVLTLYKWDKTTVDNLPSGKSKTTHFWSQIGTSKTDIHGEFWFTQLNPGKYSVVELPQNDWILSTGQPTSAPGADTDPNNSNVLVIESRREYVWESSNVPAYETSAFRPMDGMQSVGDKDWSDADGKITADEVLAGYNSGILKNITHSPVLTFGNYKVGKITGFKYEDYDKNGSYDPAIDKPLGNVKMDLTGPGGPYQVVTKADGTFEFTGLKPGIYSLTESALTDTNGDGTPDVQQEMLLDPWAPQIILTSGETESGYKFANYVYGSIHGVKFHDLDGDGVKDGGEGPIGDIVFELYKYDKSVTTNYPSGKVTTKHLWDLVDQDRSESLHGEFWFTHLVPGKYEVIEPSGQMDPADGKTWNLSSGQPTGKPDWDPATSKSVFEIVSRREFVWELGAASRPMDTDKSGVLEPAEITAGINAGKLKNEVLATAAADAAPADKSQNLLFGNYKNIRIFGYKYEDIKRDGFTGDDVKLDNVKMVLSGTNGKGQAVNLGPVLTGKDAWPDGYFEFEVPPGNYNVSESTATDTNSDNVPDNQQDMVLDSFVENLTVTSGGTNGSNETQLSHKWLNFVYGSIHGIKFYDLNGDGVFDVRSGDTLLPGIKFDLWKYGGSVTTTLASGGTKVAHSWTKVDSAVTDKHGEFWFTQLNPGSYEVREDLTGTTLTQTTAQPQGAPDSNTPLNQNYAMEIISRREFVAYDGQSKTQVDGMIAVDKFDSTRVDGFIDNDEVQAAINAGALKNEVFTTSLRWGNRWKDSSVHGFKFHDRDGDKIWDQKAPEYPSGGEEPLGNVWVNLLGNNNVIAGDKTMENGEFWFTVVWNPATGLIPGQTVFSFNEDFSKSDINNDWIPDGQQGLAASTLGGSFTLAPDQHAKWNPGPTQADNDLRLMIGNFVTGSIHGFKFADLNADGIYQPSNPWNHPETPFEWGRFDLLDSKGNPAVDAYGKPVQIMSTDLWGEFWFEGLSPGTYTVRERMDLTDRNDLNGDGYPDFTDLNNDGYPETMGNGISDDKEGLRASTPFMRTFTIVSGQEYVWENGAAMLGSGNLVSLEPIPPNQDSPTIPSWIKTVAGNPVVYGADAQATTGNMLFARGGGSTLWGLDLSQPNRALDVDFPGVVKSVSITVIADSNLDLGSILAYDANGNSLGSASTALLTAGQTAQLTFSNPNISRVLIGGGAGSEVKLDNLRWTVDPLKYETLVGSQLMFGNYYNGSIHGFKVQAGTGLPAPGIPLQLLDVNGNLVQSTTSMADGEYWFMDVKPGTYTIKEVATPSVLVISPPISVMVDNGQTVMAEAGQAVPTGPWAENYWGSIDQVQINPALKLVNTIAGSIHGVVRDFNGQPVNNYEVTISRAPGFTQTGVTNAQGHFWFEDLHPGNYVVDPAGAQYAPIVVTISSGEEESGLPGQAMLDPGQYETVNPQLIFGADAPPPDKDAPRIKDIKVTGTSWQAAFKNLVDPANGIGFSIPDGVEQAEPLPWANINRLVVQFTEDVRGSGPGGALDKSDFALVGVNTIAYAINSVTYDPVNFRATLNLASSLPTDKLILAVDDLSIADASGNKLDGEWTNNVTTGNSGNGSAGGVFEYAFNVSPGNYSLVIGNGSADPTGIVNFFDMSAMGLSFGGSISAGSPNYNRFSDGNADGVINFFDMSILGLNFGHSLPAGSPMPAPPMEIAAAIDSLFESEDGFDDGLLEDLTATKPRRVVTSSL